MTSKETVNYYDVFGLKYDASIEEIRKKYNKLIIKYHPDKIKNKEDEGIFEIIQRAYEILSDDKKRQEYDFYLNNIKSVSQVDHYSLKKDFDDYVMKYYTDTNKEKSQKNFLEQFNSLDEKHGISREDKSRLDADEISSRLDNLILEREQDEIEFSQNNIFTEFDSSKFNSAYDLYKSADSTQITEYKDVKPFNFDNLASFGDNDTLYEGNSKFSNINIFDKPKVNLSKDKIKNIKSSDYTENHNKLDIEYNNEIEKRIKERELETSSLYNMGISEFNNDSNDYLFSHQVGITQNVLEWQSNEESLENCRKLIELEKDS